MLEKFTDYDTNGNRELVEMLPQYSADTPDILYVDGLRAYLLDPMQAYSRNVGGLGDGMVAYFDEDVLAGAAYRHLAEIAQTSSSYLARRAAEFHMASPLGMAARDPTLIDEWSLNSEMFYQFAKRLDSDGSQNLLMAIRYDQRFLQAVGTRNLLAAESVILQRHFEIPDTLRVELERDYTFMIKVHGEWSSSDPDSFELMEMYYAGKEVDYKRIRNYTQDAIVQVAPGVVGFYQQDGKLADLFDLNGVEPGSTVYPTEITDVTQAAFSDLPEVSARVTTDSFLSFVRDLDSRAAIEDAFGMYLAGLSLKDQAYLARLTIDADEKQITAVRQLVEKSGIGVVGAVRAVEFGDDYVDRILAIIERNVDNQEEIFYGLNSIRESAETVAAHFGDLAPNIKTAFIKRTTELLAIMADSESTADDINAARQALTVVRYAANQIAQSVNGSVVFDAANMEPGVNYATLKSENGTTITVRPSGETRRIGFTVKIPAELLPESAMGKDKRLSIRLDDDDRGLSLDIGSSTKDGINAAPIAQFVAEQLAEGERRLNAEIKNGNHVREAFVDVDMTPEKFQELTVDFVDSLHVAEVPQSIKNAA